jgi:DNA sulfur modification protein DndB
MPAAAAFTYQFSALRGYQAGRDYYAAMVPLGLVPKLFVFDDEELKPELRAQRKLNRSRIPEIAKYVLENPREYVFSALTASVDGQVRFDAASEKGTQKGIGVLTIPMSARFVINDGQHRRAAIEQVLRDRPDFGAETICVVLFVDAGLKRSQQMFADLNKHAVRPTRSLGILYDHRDPLSQLAKQLAGEVPIFRDLTEMDKATISNRSIKLFTLSSIYFATRQLLEKPVRAPVSIKEAQLSKEFWIEVAKHMPDWQRAARRTVSSAELRRDYIHAHGVALQALAMAGAELIERAPRQWRARLKALEEIDWSRNNRKVWEGRATIGGRVSKATNNVVLTANVIKEQLGLGLTDTQEKVERIHGDAKRQRTTLRGNSSPRSAHAERRAAAGA